MQVDLSKYKGLNICVAVSGGKDSMALLHYLFNHKEEYGITLWALNCDHGIRGETSAQDSEFVRQWCAERGIPVHCFKEDCVALAKTLGVGVEAAAREWRQWCYSRVAERMCTIATAHHLNDNAETVLFNLARGSSLSGVTGINDGEVRLKAAIGEDNLPRPIWYGGKRFCTVSYEVIRPLIGCSRQEIDDYISENGIPYVEDESNESDEYTRNYIRHHVLPELERAVPGAAKSIYRFSRLANETQRFVGRITSEFNLFAVNGGALIKHCAERVPFSQTAVTVVREYFGRKDYTLAHIEALFYLQFAETGKKYEFLGLTAFKERGRIAIRDMRENSAAGGPFGYRRGLFCGFTLIVADNENQLPRSFAEKGERNNLETRFDYDIKTLRFDRDKIPDGAVVRTRRRGDKFTKFGGGTKSLGDFFTDKKIPLRLRDILPLVAVGNEILAIAGVEISDKIKVTENTRNVGYIYCDAII